MKYFVFFFLVCVAMAAAAPQLITPWGTGVLPYSGLINPGIATRTLVAGPTVINGLNGLAGVPRIYTPGIYGATYI